MSGPGTSFSSAFADPGAAVPSGGCRVNGLRMKLEQREIFASEFESDSWFGEPRRLRGRVSNKHRTVRSKHYLTHVGTCAVMERS